MVDLTNVTIASDGALVKCPLCGKVERVNLSDDETEKLILAANKVLLLQEALPERTTYERELFLSNLCYDCQKTMSGTPKPAKMAVLRGKNSKIAARVKEMVEREVESA